jgi:hypothetical protein
MRRALAILLLGSVLVGTAAAATVRGTARGELLRGTARPDRILGGAGDDRISAAFGGTDTATCGAGRDLVVADRSDRVARDCELVVRRISVDATTNPGSQHETAVEPDSFAWGTTVVAAFQVGRFASGGASAIGWATSTDEGQTWRNGTLPGLTLESKPAGDQSRASDPAVAYDAVHGVWLVSSLTLVSNTSNIRVSRSANGVAWDAPVQVANGPILDKEWIACDNGSASPFRGRCYVVYTDDSLHRVSLQSSTDGGLTWSEPVRVAGELIGAQPVVRPDGSLVVVVADLPGESDNDAGSNGSILAFKSVDGGATFARSSPVADVRWHDTGMRAIPLPSAAVDSAGTITIAWHDCRFRAGCSANDILVSSSADGTSWTAPRRVPLDAPGSGIDHFITGLDADPAGTGRLALVYAFYAPRSCGGGTCRLEIGFVTSRDAGATWSAAQRLDAEPFPVTWIARTDSGRMVGDYFSVSFAGDRIVPVFALASPPIGTHFREAIFASSFDAQRVGKRP